MQPKKPWTMMVYLAADNNLSTFGVDNLRQMKVAAHDNVNILAEFDTGPMNEVKRYCFDGREPIGPIAHNVVDTFGPTNAADPDNLADFIAWGANNYPAEHYFVVIWGHGGGVDDDFPRHNDNSFVPRHPLLSLFKGTQDDHPKGTQDDHPKGTQDDHPKGVFDVRLTGLLDAHLREIGDVLKIGDDALHQAVIDALRHGVSHALGERVLFEIEQLHLNGRGNRVAEHAHGKHFEHLRTGVLDALTEAARGQLESGVLSSLRAQFLAALQRGILDALRSGVLHQLQIAVLNALNKNNLEAAIEQIRRVALKAILQFLENGILEAQQMDIFDVVKNRIVSPTKSIAFVDHPEGFLTNIGLKKALEKACARIGQKIDILGMDSCNMNMIEIGYELRDSVNFMVASQDEIPDASWPYDRIIAKLVSQPYISPPMLAGETTSTYVQAYKDYSNEVVTPDDPATQGEAVASNEPVALSVLDLERCKSAASLISKLAERLRAALQDFEGKEAIFRARGEARSFGGDQFVDLIHLCELLTQAAGNPQLARTANPGSEISVNQAITELTSTANSLIGPLRTIIKKNKFSGEHNCNGTSIYFPEYDPQQEEHERRLGELYQQLDLAKASHWDIFVSDFLKQQKRDFEVANVLAGATDKKTPCVGVPKALLDKVEQASKAAASELVAVAQDSQSGVSTINDALSGAVQVAQAVLRKVESFVADCRNGGPNGKDHHHNGAHKRG